MGNKYVESMFSMSTTSQEVTSDILVLEFTIVTACLRRIMKIGIIDL